MAPALGLVVAASVVLGVGLGRPAQLDFDKADADTVRLKPSDLPGLPGPVRADLEQRGCTVPQPFTRRGGAANVVRGRFLSTTPIDVAVLCSRARRSAILVYRGGAAPAAAELASRPDATFLQVVDGAGGIGFSRSLAAAAPERIARYASHRGGSMPDLEHDGIEDAFLEKASSIWYWSAGRWRELPGAD